METNWLFSWFPNNSLEPDKGSTTDPCQALAALGGEPIMKALVIAAMLATASAFPPPASAQHGRAVEAMDWMTPAEKAGADYCKAHAPPLPVGQSFIVAAMTVGALTNLRWGAPARAVFPEMDQLGNEPAVWLSEFTIEEGQDPIYLAVHANRGTALRFRGAVDRLSHVVVFTALDDRLRGKQEAAVIGLPRDKIHFVTQPRTTEHRFDCLDGNMLRPTPHLFAQTVRYMFGRDADRTIQSDSSAHVMLPSGKDGPTLGYAAYEPRTPAARAVLRAFAAEQRHGAVRLSVNDIVSPAQYEEHERAPWVLGLLPLIDSGAITPLRPRVQRGLSVEGGQFLEVIGNPDRITLGAGVVATERHTYHRFRINAPVILPRMLGGPNLSEQIAFFLVPGVPRPEGFIPGKCLFDYGTGRPLLDAGVTLKDC